MTIPAALEHLKEDELRRWVNEKTNLVNSPVSATRIVSGNNTCAYTKKLGRPIVHVMSLSTRAVVLRESGVMSMPSLHRGIQKNTSYTC
jgi:hypothetical protein